MKIPDRLAENLEVWKHRLPQASDIDSATLFDFQSFLELGESGKNGEPRIIPMRIGRVRNQWVKNCVAIGLAGGFIEPLESTAIHMVDHAARWLAENLPGKDMSPPLRDRYNRQMGRVYDEVLDFICLHYRLGNRTDDQWLSR